MNLDQQIKLLEDCIARLEERIKAGSGDMARLNKDLGSAYDQMALLKIRKMMKLA